tara:strand:- start:149 stop:454 length:306 start_codon:yes stop_codon:yes gene_type:complete
MVALPQSTNVIGRPTKSFVFDERILARSAKKHREQRIKTRSAMKSALSYQYCFKECKMNRLTSLSAAALAVFAMFGIANAAVNDAQANAFAAYSAQQVHRA